MFSISIVHMPVQGIGEINFFLCFVFRIHSVHERCRVGEHLSESEIEEVVTKVKQQKH